MATPRDRLRREIMLFGEPHALPVKDVTCTFILTLPGDPMKIIESNRVLLVCSKDRDLLERVRHKLLELSGNCGEITDPPARHGEGLSMRFDRFDSYYRVNDGLSRHLLEESVRTGKRQWYSSH